ncbi:baseplate assembly protein [Micromonospora sp. AP08]|uniref:phage baseplate assembly protein V n=1 Tax=Micromonospora sp. AP08 TaxID=2604467 RepID=UPI0011D358F8|nr:phage baseplate assembly protein V [Micromonospora sp. AP08]TYB39677.1 baseplate assembly protein [Micromonospora sp. AP08]
MTATTSHRATRHFGKYRGTVVNNIDPMMRGRLLVEVPDAIGLAPSSWAEACVPLAGPTGPPMGTWFVPPVGAGVWVEFERGDLSRPVWSGCRWGSPADPPTLALNGLPVSPSIVMQTAGQNAIAISDVPGPTGGIMLKSATGATLIVNDTGIYIQNGKGASIVMVGPTVTVNAGALTVV